MPLIAGTIALVCDGSYRWLHPHGHWLSPVRGGSFCFVPVWVCGMCWLVLNVFKAITGVHPTSLTGGIILGVLVATILAVAIVRVVRGDRFPVMAEEEESTWQRSPRESSSAFPEPKNWEGSRCGYRNPDRVRTCGRSKLAI